MVLLKRKSRIIGALLLLCTLLLALHIFMTTGPTGRLYVNYVSSDSAPMVEIYVPRNAGWKMTRAIYSSDGILYDHEIHFSSGIFSKRVKVISLSKPFEITCPAKEEDIYDFIREHRISPVVFSKPILASGTEWMFSTEEYLHAVELHRR